MECAVTDFPDPLSPTKAVISPAVKVKEIRSTTVVFCASCAAPVSSTSRRNAMDKSLTERMADMACSYPVRFLPARAFTAIAFRETVRYKAKPIIV